MTSVTSDSALIVCVCGAGVSIHLLCLFVVLFNPEVGNLL